MLEENKQKTNKVQRIKKIGMDVAFKFWNILDIRVPTNRKGVPNVRSTRKDTIRAEVPMA